MRKDAPNGTSERSLASILARGRARRRRRRYVYPPDYTHGSIELDVLHRTFGDVWAESTAFVTRPHDRTGPVDGWTVATFDDRFLEVVHHSSTEPRGGADTLRERLEACSNIVGLSAHDGAPLPECPEEATTIPVDTTVPRLRWLERAYLGVSRERELRAASFQSSAEDVLLATRLDLLSLVGLCAELVDDAS